MSHPHAPFILTIRARPLLWRAVLSLLAGMLVYLLARNQAPDLAPGWLQTAPQLIVLRNFIPDILTAQLPSFVHAYFILLVSASVTGDARWCSATIIGGTLVCLALECVQHPALTAVLANPSPELTGHIIREGLNGSGPGNLYQTFFHYADSGHFDTLDLAAILMASIVATLHINALSRRQITPPRSY